MSESVGELHYDLTLNDKKLRSQLDDAEGHFKRFGNSVVSLGKTLAAGVAIGGAAAVAFGVTAVKAYSEAQDAIVQTNAVLKSTGGIAGVTEQQVSELATALQKVTKFSDEEIRSGENLLLTFTNISKDIFPEATETMLNMSQALGQDLKGSAIQLGKALQDPILGVTALRRVGVNFTEAQQDVIKNLVATGKSAEAQKLILKELQVEFGGSARAAGQTFAGKLAILKNSFNDVQESIGKVIVEALTPWASKLSDFVASDKFQKWLEKLTVWINTNLPKAIDYVVNTLWPQLVKAFDAAWPVVKILIEWLGNLFKFITDNMWVLWGVVGVFATIRTAMFLSGALQAFTTVIAGVSTVYGGLMALIASPLIMPALAIAAALASIALVYKAIESVRGALNDLDKSAEASKSYHNQQMDAARKYIPMTKSPYSPETQAMARKTLHAFEVPGYAKGIENFQGGLAYVHKGEMLANLPKGTDVIPRREVDKMTTKNNTFTGNIYLGDQGAVKEFFGKLDRDNTLEGMGLSPLRT